MRVPLVRDLGNQQRAQGASPAPQERASLFDIMDRNHDGVLTRSEFVSAMGGAQPVATMAMPVATYRAAPVVGARVSMVPPGVMQGSVMPVAPNGMPVTGMQYGAGVQQMQHVAPIYMQRTP